MQLARAGFGAIALVLLGAGPAQFEWQPKGLHAAHVTLSDVLAARARAAGTPPAAERRERWTYAAAGRRIPVEVAVRGDDFRATMHVGGLTYQGGRAHGERWRADGNGVVHLSYGDLQGDALDRLPQSAFPFDTADCALAGETAGSAPQWVVVDRPPHDKAHWFFIDEQSGDIVRETTREGSRNVTTTFAGFTSANGARRPQAWQVRDGDRGDDLDVSVDAVEAESVLPGDVAVPTAHRMFTAPAGTPSSVTLPASFRGRTIFVDGEIAGQRGTFILDTGTQSVMLDVGYAARRGFAPLLEHATVPRIRIGPFALDDASVLTPNLGVLGYRESGFGLLGLDFFEGHVVHIDYANRRVEVVTHEAAARVFDDPRFTVVRMDVAEGLPLVAGRIGTAAGSRFALDSGSEHVSVFAPFVERNRATVEHDWPPAQFARGHFREDDFLEGSTLLEARQAPELQLGPARFTNPVLGVEIPNAGPDAIAIPFDAIVGTDALHEFDLWFDYDNGRLALRLAN